MPGKFQRRTANEDRRYRRGWKRLTAVLSPVVALATLSSLVLPAITMSSTACALTEHQHTQECYTASADSHLDCSYETLGVHVHEKACYGEQDELTCILPDFLVHTHGASCYQEGTLVCSLPEIKAHTHTDACYGPAEEDKGHAHTDECYEWTQNVCTLEEGAGHSHGDTCYAAGGELICTQEETSGHTHGDDCLAKEDTLICTQSETAAHAHADGCWTEEAALTCTQTEEEGHAHGDGCYGEDGALVCTLEETSGHTHGDGCWGKSRVSQCTLEETSGHTHGENCWIRAGALTCTQEETPAHAHGEGCYAQAGDLLCTTQEAPAHIHEESCSARVQGALICGEEAREPAENDGELVLTCEEEEIILHTHEDACYLQEYAVNETTESWILDLFKALDEDAQERKVLICTKPEIQEHQHEEACRKAGEPTLTCQIPEHTHSTECQKQVTAADVAALIEAIPTADEIETNLTVKSGEEKDAYMTQIQEQIKAALAAYNALSQEEQSQVSNYALLTDYAYFITEDPAAREVIGCIAGLPTLAEFEEGYKAQSSIQKPLYVEDISGQITQINAQYDALTQEQQAMVLNRTKLIRLEAYLASLARADGTLEFVADDYTTTVTVTNEANLPGDTVVTARPLFDSQEAEGISAFSPFSLFSAPEEETESQEDGLDYARQIMEAVTWGEVTRIKLFDITLTSGNEQVQPAAPVQVRTEFADPLYLEEGEVVYGVHIGEKGVDILPATAERNENGDIVAITHTQSSFSPSGYILVHIPNPEDVGHDVLPVHYCIWVNDQWIIAGSSRTGWYGNYTNADDWSDDTRDYITLAQIGYVLEPYGLNIQDHEEVWRTLWYQRAEDQGMTIRHDTGVVTKTINGQQVPCFELSGNLVKDDGYHIYYAPAGVQGNKETDKNTTYARNRDLAADLKQESKFYTLTIRDRMGVVYKDPAEVPETQVIQYGQPCSVTVKANNNNNKGWQWVNDKGTVVHGIDRIMVGKTEPDPRFWYTDNGDGTETYRFGLTEEEAKALNDAGVKKEDGTAWTATGILGRTTLIPYSQTVDGAEMDTNKKVDVVVHLDGEWQKVGQISLMYRQNGICERKDAAGNVTEQLWFVTAGQVYSVLSDFGFEPKQYAPDDENNIGHVFVHAVGAFDDNAKLNGLTFCADGINTPMEETVAIGMGHPGAANEDHFTLFYLPGSENEGYDAVHQVNSNTYATESKDAEGNYLIANDRFYSIKVTDDYQLVYYGYETDNFRAYVRGGHPASVSVQNALSVLWSIREPWKIEAPAAPNQYIETQYTATQDGNFNRYDFAAVNGPIQIEASSLNPSYTVQYFASIERYRLYDAAGNNRLPLINTSGKVLPSNGATTTDTTRLKYLGVKTGGLGNTNQNAGNATALHAVDTYTDNTEIYKEKQFVYDRAHLWRNIDKLYNNDGYVIKEVWILKDGMDPKSTDRKDWWVYTSTTNGGNITFTNQASKENIKRDENDEIQDGADHTILITEGMIMRLYYELLPSDYTDNAVNFYDYDISSDGKNVRQQGINSIHNNKTNTANRYAFGNDNCFTGMGTAEWNGQELNQYNNGVYRGCTFGLVQAIDPTSGAITWGSGITAPAIFSQGNVTGKTNYTGSLTFDRRGDVYTLKASNVAGGSRTGLNYFFNPAPDASTTHTHIFTNNFWAMDGATNRKDGLWGAGTGTSRGVVNGYANGAATNTRGDSVTNKNLPQSDDGRNHNWFFGMSFGIGFNISDDYTGPLEYIFFGDDDMWVFLDSDTNGDGVMDKSELICDIGGVHSAVGEYVNLRDYLPLDGPYTAGNHNLRFYYTERGASGSTCWMSFTLPSVTSTTVSEGIAEIAIQKSVLNAEGKPIEFDEDFEFTINIYTDALKNTLINTPFSVQIDRADGTTDYQATESGKSIFLYGGDKARILGVPIGTYYVIQEAKDSRFTVEANGKEGYVLEGTAQTGVNTANFINHLQTYHLPDTGGSGIAFYVFGGLLLMTAPLKYWHNPKKQGRRRRS